MAITFNITLISDVRNWGLFELFLHLSRIYDGKICFFKNGEWISSYIVLHKYILTIFSASNFIVSWYSKFFCYFFIEIIMSLLSPSISFASVVTSALVFSSSASCYSDSCNKYGLFFLPESDCSNVVPIKPACM